MLAVRATGIRRAAALMVVLVVWSPASAAAGQEQSVPEAQDELGVGPEAGTTEAGVGVEQPQGIPIPPLPPGPQPDLPLCYSGNVDSVYTDTGDDISYPRSSGTTVIEAGRPVSLGVAFITIGRGGGDIWMHYGDGTAQRGWFQGFCRSTSFEGNQPRWFFQFPAHTYAQGEYLSEAIGHCVPRPFSEDPSGCYDPGDPEYYEPTPRTDGDYAIEVRPGDPPLPDGTPAVLGLGDSYSSGEGAPSFETSPRDTDAEGVNQCHRSREWSWSERWTREVLGLLVEEQHVNGACSGAVVGDLFDRGHAWPNEVAQSIRISDDYDAVTLTAGGNDSGFGPILLYCIARIDCHESSLFASDNGPDRLSRRINSLFPVLKTAYETLRARAGPDTPVIVSGYPQFLPCGSQSDPGCAAQPTAPATGPACPNAPFSRGETSWMRSKVIELNAVIEQAAAEAGVWYQDVTNVLRGHQLCTPDPWVVGLVEALTAAGVDARPQMAMHPDADGYRAWSRAIDPGLLGEPNPEPVPAGSPPGPSTGAVSLEELGGRANQTAIFAAADVYLFLTVPGFAGGTPVRARLYSDPVDLGTVTANDDGDAVFSGNDVLRVDMRSVAPGPHVLEFEGVGPDGEPRVVVDLVEIPSCAGFGPFPDVSATSPFCREIAWFRLAGIGEGFADGTFRPGGDLTRQAMAAFLFRLGGEPQAGSTNTTGFPDVSPSHPFAEEIAWLADTGITGGYSDGTFRPSAALTRQAMAAFLYRMAGEPEPGDGAPAFPDVPTGHPFLDEIGWLATTGITGGYGDGTFRPGADLTRQAMAAFLYRYRAQDLPLPT